MFWLNSTGPITGISESSGTGRLDSRCRLLRPGFSLSTVEKKKLVMPREIEGIARCMNPKCITNHQPVKTRFTTIDNGNEISLLCHYCEKITDIKGLY